MNRTVQGVLFLAGAFGIGYWLGRQIGRDTATVSVGSLPNNRRRYYTAVPRSMHGLNY